MTGAVRLTDRPLSVPAAARALAGPGLGGVVLFVGRVRPDRTAAGRVVALDYEADRRRAVRRLEEIAREARSRFGAGRVVLWHRVGRVPVDAPSVIVGAAAGHRAPAFAAARFLIEELKRSVPLWKATRARPARPRRPRPRRRTARSAG
ncbi:MAG TPA: molybdenum cofactor biosynthesis protein MoaE [Thermoplasmata archaeon]|nr:molybdenum cofactor biosynthesis protein MoaE [Thermoplasmata archaeon]